MLDVDEADVEDEGRGERIHCFRLETLDLRVEGVESDMGVSVMVTMVDLKSLEMDWDCCVRDIFENGLVVLIVLMKGMVGVGTCW